MVLNLKTLFVFKLNIRTFPECIIVSVIAQLELLLSQ
jgi:hypothetical protein